MKIIDLQKQAAVITSAANITLGAPLDNCRTLAQAIAAGDIAVGVTGVSFFVREPVTGAFESGEYTIVDDHTLQQTKRTGSSNNGQAVAFGGVPCEVYSAASAAGLNALLSSADGVAMAQLNSAPTAAGATDTFLTALVDPATNLGYKATVAFLKSIFGSGSGGTVVDYPANLSAISATATGPTTATGSVTTNETGGTIYWLWSTKSTATAVEVKAGQSAAVTAAGALSLPGTGLNASTPYYLHALHRDTFPQDSAVLSLAQPITTQAAGTPAPAVTGISLSPGTANVAAGGKVQLTATVTVTNGGSTAVNYAVSPSGAGTVNSSGLFTASSMGGVTAIVTATSVQDPSKSATSTITVAAAVSNAPAYIVSNTGSNAATPTAGTTTATTDGGTDRYAAGQFTVYIKTVANAVPGAVRMLWGPSPTVRPKLQSGVDVAYPDLANGLPIGVSGNGATHGNGAVQAAKTGGWVATSDPTYGLWGSAGQLIAWVTAANLPTKRYPWVYTDDGFISVVKDASGNPIEWSLT